MNHFSLKLVSNVLILTVSINTFIPFGYTQETQTPLSFESTQTPLTSPERKARSLEGDNHLPNPIDLFLESPLTKSKSESITYELKANNTQLLIHLNTEESLLYEWSGEEGIGKLMSIQKEKLRFIMP